MKTPPSTGPRVTLYDVARHAGVSFKTAARVMNNEVGVRAVTRERVLSSMRKLNYVPNVAARQLAGQRSFLIAFANRYADEYAAELQIGAMRRCRDHGYHLVVDQVAVGDEVETCQRLSGLRVEGVVVTPPLARTPAFLSSLEEMGLKHVLVSPEVNDPRVASVRIDDERAGYEITRHLLDLGHRSVAFIGGGGWPASDRRRAGYNAALRAAGVERRPELDVEGNFSFRSGEACADTLLSLESPPTAIFAANDPMALGAMHAASRRGLQLPNDLSVAGFDDSPSASVVWPQLTTVRQPLHAMASAAIDLLLARALPTPSAALSLDFELIKRGSTAPPRSGSSFSR
ncbi:MAG: LacI family DNA-binding transcriptional regulator [Proteobacteria bacterium]|nr:LacI family DNA-binding transcriptional regulator [Pseudomonadota bacterium]